MTSDESFSKRERLIKTKDFRPLYRGGRSFKAGFIILKIAPNTLPINRIGFSISAKSIKRANRRNRIRRCLREAYRKNKRLLKKGFDMVFIVRKDSSGKFSYEDAKKTFLKLSKEAGILV